MDWADSEPDLNLKNDSSYSSSMQKQTRNTSKTFLTRQQRRQVAKEDRNLDDRWGHDGYFEIISEIDRVQLAERRKSGNIVGSKASFTNRQSAGSSVTTTEDQSEQAEGETPRPKPRFQWSRIQNLIPPVTTRNTKSIGEASEAGTENGAKMKVKETKVQQKQHGKPALSERKKHGHVQRTAAAHHNRRKPAVQKIRLTRDAAVQAGNAHVSVQVNMESPQKHHHQIIQTDEESYDSEDDEDEDSISEDDIFILDQDQMNSTSAPTFNSISTSTTIPTSHELAPYIVSPSGLLISKSTPISSPPPLTSQSSTITASAIFRPAQTKKVIMKKPEDIQE